MDSPHLAKYQSIFITLDDCIKKQNEFNLKHYGIEPNAQTDVVNETNWLSDSDMEVEEGCNDERLEIISEEGGDNDGSLKIMSDEESFEDGVVALDNAENTYRVEAELKENCDMVENSGQEVAAPLADFDDETKKTFSTKNNYGMFSCQHCGYMAHHRRIMLEHYRSKHKIPIYICGYNNNCEDLFPSKELKEIHSEKFHNLKKGKKLPAPHPCSLRTAKSHKERPSKVVGVNPFECLHCGDRFKTVNLYFHHLYKVHKE